MQKLSSLIFFLFVSSVAGGDVYQYKLEPAKGKKIIDFSRFKNKYILVTNIATRCGYTPQLSELEKISKKENVIVVAIPSGNFGDQTPENNEKIVEFCRAKYDIKGEDFFITKKSEVKGKSKIPLIAYLQSLSSKKEIKWNFEKYLVFPGGKKVKHFSSSQIKEILKEIK